MLTCGGILFFMERETCGILRSNLYRFYPLKTSALKQSVSDNADNSIMMLEKLVYRLSRNLIWLVLKRKSRRQNDKIDHSKSSKTKKITKKNSKPTALRYMITDNLTKKKMR